MVTRDGAETGTPPHSVSPERIAALAALDRGWDGHGARPVTEAALAVAKLLHVVPTVAGGLQIEWHCNGWDVEIDVDENGEPSGFYVVRSG